MGLIILGLGSIFVGYLGQEIYVGQGGSVSGIYVDARDKIGIEVEEGGKV